MTRAAYAFLRGNRTAALVVEAIMNSTRQNGGFHVEVRPPPNAKHQTTMELAFYNGHGTAITHPGSRKRRRTT